MKKQKPFTIIGVASVIVSAVKLRNFSAILDYIGVAYRAFVDYKSAEAAHNIVAFGSAYIDILFEKETSNPTLYVGVQYGKKKQPLTKISSSDGAFEIENWEQYAIVANFLSSFYDKNCDENTGKIFACLAFLVLQWEDKHPADFEPDEQGFFEPTQTAQ